MPKMKRKQIKIDEKLHSDLMLIAKILDVPLTKFLRTFSKEFLPIIGNFRKASVFFDGRGDTLLLTCYGKYGSQTGSFDFGGSDEECDKEIMRRVAMSHEKGEVEKK